MGSLKSACTTSGSLKISRRNLCSPFFSVSYSINRHKILQYLFSIIVLIQYYIASWVGQGSAVRVSTSYSIVIALRLLIFVCPTTSYRSSLDTIALNCLVFEKIACLHFGDRQTDKQTDRLTNKQMDSTDALSTDALSRSRCRERRRNKPIAHIYTGRQEFQARGVATASGRSP